MPPKNLYRLLGHSLRRNSEVHQSISIKLDYACSHEEVEKSWTSCFAFW